MRFSGALDALDAGFHVTRTGWNGKGMHIERINPNVGDTITESFLAIKPVTGGLIPWTISQADINAQDWVIIHK